MKKYVKIPKRISNCISNEYRRDILIFGVSSIISTIFTLYERYGFNIWRFLFIDLPLFYFCGKALYRIFELTDYNNKFHDTRRTERKDWKSNYNFRECTAFSSVYKYSNSSNRSIYREGIRNYFQKSKIIGIFNFF